MRGLVGRAETVRRAGDRRDAARRPALPAVLALAAALALGSAPARAEEGGFFGFLRTALGGGQAAPAPAASAPPMASEGEQVRPLTVRRAPGAQRKAAHAPGAGRAHLARVPARTGPVSIYEDPTLRSGDAVMTKDGMKVFAGGRFSPDHPYVAGDFIAVSAAKSVAPEIKKTVIELNKLPHG